MDKEKENKINGTIATGCVLLFIFGPPILTTLAYFLFFAAIAKYLFF